MKQYLKKDKNNTSIYFDGPVISPAKWAKVKKAVENIEGQWNSSTQQWDFPFDVSRLYEIMQGKDFKLSSHYQFFETPRWLIEGYMSYRYQMMRSIAYHNDYKVLEPGAGRGKILEFLHSRGMAPDFCEIMPENREILSKKGFNNLVGEDFLELDRPNYYDLVFANPPFNKGKKHIKKMMEVCKPGGSIVTLASFNILDDPKFEGWLEESCVALDAITLAPFDENATYIIDEQIFKGTKVGCTLLTMIKN